MASYYDVAPRYTPGSPAMVREELALKAAKDEKHFIEHALEGVWGEAQKERAEKLGLRGIVERRVERRGYWEIHDLCTDEHFKRLFPEKLTKLGWRRFDELVKWEQDLALDQCPTDIPDPKKAWFKVEHQFVSGFLSYPKVLVYRPEKVVR